MLVSELDLSIFHEMMIIIEDGAAHSASYMPRTYSQVFTENKYEQ